MLYEMMMVTMWWAVGTLLIAVHSIGRGVDRQTSSANAELSGRRRHGRFWGQSCARACVRKVDDDTNPGDCEKVRGITLGIEKYPLTWCFSSAKVSLVPESARRPGPGNRVVRRTPPGDPSAITSSVHEAKAGPDGARNHSLWVPSRRATGGHGHRVTGPRPKEHPNCSRRRSSAASLSMARFTGSA